MHWKKQSTVGAFILVFLLSGQVSHAQGTYRWEIATMAGTMAKQGYSYVSHHPLSGGTEYLKPLPGTDWRCALEASRNIEVLPGVPGLARHLICRHRGTQLYTDAEAVFVPRPPGGGPPIGKSIELSAEEPLTDKLYIKVDLVW